MGSEMCIRDSKTGEREPRADVSDAYDRRRTLELIKQEAAARPKYSREEFESERKAGFDKFLEDKNNQAEEVEEESTVVRMSPKMLYRLIETINFSEQIK